MPACLVSDWLVHGLHRQLLPALCTCIAKNIYLIMTKSGTDGRDRLNYGDIFRRGTEIDLYWGVYMRTQPWYFKHSITVMLNTGIRHLITRNPVVVWYPELGGLAGALYRTYLSQHVHDLITDVSRSNFLQRKCERDGSSPDSTSLLSVRSVWCPRVARQPFLTTSFTAHNAGPHV